MKKKYITVREWIKNYEAGKYDDPSFNVQCSAGWNDWYGVKIFGEKSLYL